MKKVKTELNLQVLLTVRKFLSYSIGLFLLSSIMILVGLIPQIQESTSLQSRLQKDKKTLASLEKKARDLENVQVKEVYAQRDLINQALPSKKPLLELLTGLNMAANQSGVKFTDFSIAPGDIATEAAGSNVKASPAKNGPKNPDRDEMQVKLTIAGELSQVRKFLEVVENMAPFTSVDNLSLSRQSNAQGSSISDPRNFVEAELLLSTYYFTKSVAVALEQPLPATGEKEQLVLGQVRAFIFPAVQNQQQIISGGLGDLFGVDSFEVLDL